MSLHHLVSQKRAASLSFISTSPASSLPPEILEFIFEECVAQAHAHNGKGWQFHYCDRRCLLDWVQITHVCSLWRTISTARKGLWSHVVFVNAEWTRTMLDRAGADPLIVSARFDGTIDHAKLLSLLLENVGRVEDLRFEGYGLAGDQLAQALDNTVGSCGAVMLKSLALLRTEYYVPRFPRSLLRTSSLKKLSLKGFKPSENNFLFDGLKALEELWLEDCLQWVAIEDSEVHLPLTLTHLHLNDVPYDCFDFLATLRLSRQLQYFGLDMKAAERGGDFLFGDSHIRLPHCIDVRNSNQTFEGNLTVALRIGLDAGPTYEDSEIILAAWPRNIASPLHVVNYARQGIIPHLPYDTAQRSEDRLLDADEVLEVRSSFAGTNPCLYISTYLDGFLDPNRESNCLPMLAKTFSLCDVVFVSISSCLYFAPRQESMSTLLRSMPSLHIIEGRYIVPALLTIALTPRVGYVPVPDLSEIWIINMLYPFQVQHIDDDNNQMDREEIETQTSAPTLSACLSARAQAGTTLVKLRLTKCEPLDTKERESIAALGIKIEEF